MIADSLTYTLADVISRSGTTLREGFTLGQLADDRELRNKVAASKAATRAYGSA